MRQIGLRPVASWIRRARIRASGGEIASSAFVGSRVLLVGSKVRIGANTFVGDKVHIAGEKLNIGSNCHIADGVRIEGKDVEIGDNSIIFSGTSIVSLGDIRIGGRAKISRGVVMRAGSIAIGTDIWINQYAEFGGGGWRSHESRLSIGDRCHIGRYSHINLARSVAIGDDTAVGMDCTLATHAQWQAGTDGYPRLRGEIKLGSNVAIYSRSVVGPGVTIHDGAVVGAGSVVTRDVDPGLLVGGVPAKALRPAARNDSRLNLPRLLSEFLVEEGGRVHSVVEEDFFCGELGRHILVFSSQLSRLIDLPKTWPFILVTDCPQVARASIDAAEAIFEVSRREVFGAASEDSERLAQFLFSTGLHFRYLTYSRPLLSFERLVQTGMELP